MSSINKPIAGMRDVFGIELRKRNHILSLLSLLVQRFGFEQLEVPVIERASSFDEKIVGRSPWPEWDKRGCFYLAVENYSGSYENQPSVDTALLNPEGTISVTRWLGKMLQKMPKGSLPLKVFYDVQCFRNELIDSLSEVKHRQFRQFGLEILGTSSVAADMEVACLMNQSLLLLGFPQEAVTIRICDVRIFRQLINDSGINYDDSLRIKELLDAIAESRAGKNPSVVSLLQRQLNEVLQKYDLSRQVHDKWNCILGTPCQHLSAATRKLFGYKYHSAFDDLEMIIVALRDSGINAKADLCVVRSHEYYTGISFEVDVVDENAAFYEIAGGGRFDRLVSSFLTESDKDTIVPSTGFAFGVERLIEAATAFGLMRNLQYTEMYTYLEVSSADRLLVPSTSKNGCKGYRDAMQEVLKSTSSERTNIYVGDDHSDESIYSYATACGVRLIDRYT